ncbi:MAG: hypothetical protein ABIO05_05150, partial [Ferruginibacter sp.]
DTILMSWVIFTIWQLAAFFTTKRFFYFFFACVGIAGGMMTKGPVALIVPLFAFGSHFLLQRNFKVFFKWQYLAGIFIIGILLFPMCIGLYQQFDMQPAKMVNGKTNVSGLRFFFWTQSFGRITGESDWKNNSTIFFGLQNMLWSFLPWIIIFLAGLLINMKDIVRQRFLLLQGQEAITTGGFILTYLSLGLSKYQLPHYIFVVFPLAAIITAKFLHALMYQKKHATLHRYFLISHSIIFFLLWLGLIALMAIPFAGIAAWVTVSATLFFITWLFCMFYYKKQKRWLFTSAVATIIAINLFLNSSFYPALLQYQMGNKAGRWLHLKEIPPQNIFIYQYPEMRSLHFYAKANIYHQDVVDSIQPGNWIITLPERLTDITRAGLSYQVFFKGEEFHISRLSLKFLNPSTRPLQLSKYVIVKIGPSN